MSDGRSRGDSRGDSKVGAMPALEAQLPWLLPLQTALDDAIRGDRLGHALLIQIAPGLGGDWLAHWLAARLFCKATTRSKPCGACVPCTRVVAGEQPDLLRLQPIEDSKEIRIDQVRELAAELALTSHGAGRKVAIISPADKLNRNAANALLKTLEEPSGSALLILVTGEPSRLPITVISRCTRLNIPLPRNPTLAEWLRATGDHGTDWESVLSVLGPKPIDALQADTGALIDLRRETLSALEQVARGGLDPVDTAEFWGKEDYALRLACIESWLVERVRHWAMAGQGSAEPLFAALEDLREARQWTDTPVSKPLALERLLWRINATAPNRRPG